MLEIRNLTKSYTNGKKAVDNLSITVEDGDIYGFIGPNGAGKSTTIKSIVGVLSFESGEIFIDGMNIKDKPIECKTITAFIPDNPDIYDHLTGIQYLNFICDVYGVSKSERNECYKKYGDMLQLTPNLGDLVSSYSHGMKQKLVIISAFAHNPKFIVMDEPFVGLDPIATHTLKNVMKEFCSGGGAIFFSTHVLEVAEKLCNKIAIIKNGKLVVEGNTSDVVGDSSLENVFLGLQENNE